jgi:hypothetical protein
MNRKSRPFLLRSLHLPKRVWGLALIYGAAGFAHLAHNAEFMAFYPGMAEGYTKEAMYLAWLGVNAVALAAMAFALLDLGVLAALSLALYGALGLGSLSHYALGFWSEHTLAANASICAEAFTGLALAVRAVRHVMKRAASRGAHPSRTPRRDLGRAARRDGISSTFH